jgi:5'-3' exonuclease
MIIVDFNQICISNLMMQIGNHTNLVFEEGLVRHMILNSLRLYKQKFGKIYGHMVIACDDKNYWRKQIYPHYKAGRKKTREESDIDWPVVFDTLNKIKDEIKQFLPFTVIQVENCEADDIIATICLNTSEDILILSADKDFIQLHSERVIQFDPIRKRNVQVEDPKQYLKELVIKGDAGDGIPNALSSGDSFVEGIRQKAIAKKKLATWLDMSWEQLHNDVPELQVGLERNKKLICLNEIPTNITSKIWLEFENQFFTPKKIDIIGYLQQYKLKTLMEHAGDFT